MYKILFISALLSVSLFANSGTLHSNSDFPNAVSRASSAELPYNYRYISQVPINDSVKIIAIKIEFQLDSDNNTTGNGRFGIWLEGQDTTHSYNDEKELNWYKNGVYTYDNLPHDSLYLSYQLDYLNSYYKKVSNGKLDIEYSIFPKGKKESDAYQVPLRMANYSPGQKLGSETYLEFNTRVNNSLMKFIRDAIVVSNTGKTATDTVDSPFKNLVFRDGVLREVDSLGNLGKRVYILLIHAGSSNLTDRFQDSNSDLTDNFISQTTIRNITKTSSGLFQHFLDTIDGTIGFKFNGYKDSTYIIPELMMISETSNQDSLNYGIHGILVNQFARQLGIPDLYSTTSGVTGIGKFGIMDFEGYSAASGFIPPYPSAWSRMYMGWEDVVVALPQDNKTINVSAVSSNSDSNRVVLVPINNHEYYLIENRQRNLSGDSSLYNYDTTDGFIHISDDSAVNYDSIVTEVSPTSNVVMATKTQEIGLPGSGILLWHIDENLVYNRLEYNLLNTDSSYRAVSLVEADGIQDIGMPFNGLSTIYDYGGAEDIFPHTNRYAIGGSDNINEITPFTAPATIANDGGNCYINIDFPIPSKNIATETYNFARNADSDNKRSRYFVTNYVDTTLQVRVSENTTSSVTMNSTYPLTIVPSTYYDLTANDITGDGLDDIAICDTVGRVTIVDNSGKILTDSSHYGIVGADTIYYSTQIDSPYTYGTAYGNTILFPSSNGNVTMLSNSVGANITVNTILSTNHFTTPISVVDNNRWVVGTKKGYLVFGNSVITDTLFTGDSSSIDAISVNGNDIITVSNSGQVTLISAGNIVSKLSLTKEIDSLIPPFKLVSGDLDGDGTTEVAITDSRQGLVLLQYNSQGELSFSPYKAFQRYPIDWAGYYREDSLREQLPLNGAAPTLSDIDGDGTLEILISGTNGIYAFNYKGVQIPQWPILLDKVNSYFRSSLFGSPVTARDSSGNLMTLFSTPTGDNLTYEVSKVYDYKKVGDKWTAYFQKSDSTIDSLTDLDSLNLFDTILFQNDSVILSYIMPGGLIDIRNRDAQRPDTTVETINISQKTVSDWPITVGNRVTISPLLTQNSNGNSIYIATNGNLYNWNVSSSVLDSVVWGTVGGTNSRKFSLNGDSSNTTISSSVDNFYSYPNPLRVIGGNEVVTFRYTLGDDASSVILSIFNVDGYEVFEKELSATKGVNEFVLQDISFLGTAPYRCQLNVKFGDNSITKIWKMVILRGRK